MKKIRLIISYKIYNLILSSGSTFQYVDGICQSLKASEILIKISYNEQLPFSVLILTILPVIQWIDKIIIMWKRKTLKDIPRARSISE